MSAKVRRKRPDDSLIILLAGGATIRDAARKAGVAEKTVSRRLADADFRRRVSELRSEMVSRACGVMADAMSAAAKTLKRLLAAKSDAIKLGAARALLELGTKLRESVELEDRIDALESKR